MTTMRWSRRRFMAMTISTSAALLLGACAGKQEETPAADSNDLFAGLEPGQGTVLDIDGEEIAAYRTEAGDVIQLLAACPHQGCPVEWDADEAQWVCPCHRSKFEPDGTLISGPAPSDLSRVS
jgi:Rieske Fe-S protein